jgi:D-glycero-D-manno-heptose 1,7-bisphosphate phosphatase
MPCSALFLDRDGVINHNHGYVHKREDFYFIDGIFDLAQHAYRQNYKLVVITNQAGIARGYYTEEQFHQLTRWMCQQFSAAGAPIDRVYFSPYHPSAGLGVYLKDDISRKPHPGMILQAKTDLSVNLSRSVLIGDMVSDIQAGNAAGIGTNLLFTPNEPPELIGLDYVHIRSLYEAVRYLDLGVQ